MRILGCILVVIGAALIIYIRLTNIDVTETRLLIDNFGGFLVAVIFVLSGYFAVVRSEKK